MATLLLQTVGSAVGSLIGGPIGGLIGSALGTIAGSAIDSALFGSGPERQKGPRLDNLQVQSSTEGSPIPEIAGRMRLAGQIIWATKFKEVAKTKTEGGKGGGGTTVKTTTYSYFANFAVALCEGVIDRVGSIWADGKPLDMAGVAMR